jgi:putative aminopeptidase FrvX
LELFVTEVEEEIGLVGTVVVVVELGTVVVVEVELGTDVDVDFGFAPTKLSYTPLVFFLVSFQAFEKKLIIPLSPPFILLDLDLDLQLVFDLAIIL